MMKKMIMMSLLLTAVFCATEVSAQFDQTSSVSLFSDVKAYKVGDALMIYIMEDTQAGNSASTSEQRSTDLEAGVNGGAGMTNMKASAGINSGNGFKADASNNRKESIRAKLSAKVIEVEDGNLKIKGTKTTTVNGETQTITIEGLVRPVDISSNNSVYSYSITDMTLTIDGDGNVAETQEPGLITKFFRILF